MEGDGWDEPLPSTDYHFYPRPPGGGRLFLDTYERPAYPISIHALRVEGDQSDNKDLIRAKLISIHALRVEGDSIMPKYNMLYAQISIHALRVEGDGDFTPDSMLELAISIHALRVEGDRSACFGKLLSEYFYPRPPGGGRHLINQLQTVFQFDFYPRPPGGGRLW